MSILERCDWCIDVRELFQVGENHYCEECKARVDNYLAADDKVNLKEGEPLFKIYRKMETNKNVMYYGCDNVYHAYITYEKVSNGTMFPIFNKRTSPCDGKTCKSVPILRKEGKWCDDKSFTLLPEYFLAQNRYDIEKKHK